MRLREAVERQQILLGALEQLGDLRRRAAETLDHLAAALAGAVVAVGVEDLPERRGHHSALRGTAVAQHVADEMDRTALPRAAEHPRDRVLQPEMLIGHAQAHPGEAALAQGAQEQHPEGLGLDLTDIQADHLPATGLMDRVRDHQRLRVHMATVADLDDLRVQPQIRMRALQRPLAERLDLIVQRPAHRADAVLAHAMDAELLDEPVDLARRHAVDVGLHHDRHDRLLTTPPRLKKRREVRARPLLGDLQLDLTDPRLPPTRPVAVAMRHPIGGHLAMPGTDLRRDLGVHQLRCDHRHRLLEEIAVLIKQGPANELLRRHALRVGHRGAFLSSIDWP